MSPVRFLVAPHSTGGVTQQSDPSYCFQANDGICLKIHGNSVVSFSQYRRLQKAKCFMSGWKPNCFPQPKVSYWVIMMLYYSKRSVRAKVSCVAGGFQPMRSVAHRSALHLSSQRAAKLYAARCIFPWALLPWGCLFACLLPSGC